MNDAYRRDRIEADNDRLRAEVGRLRSVLEDLAETGGWRTEWVTDEADGSRGPSTWNETKDLARAALAEGAPMTEAELAQWHYDHQDELDASEGELVDDVVIAEDLAVNRPGDPE